MQNESSNGIKALHDISKECVLSLGNAGINTENWDPILIHILIKKLDRNSRSLYEQSLKQPRELQGLKEFFEFLELRFQALEAQGGTKQISKTEQSHNKYGQRTVLATATQMNLCKACKGDHQLYSCKIFKGMKISERVKLVKDKRLCINCLQAGHFSTDCKSRNCLKCTKKHNTLLHDDAFNKNLKYNYTDKGKGVQLSNDKHTSSQTCNAVASTSQATTDLNNSGTVAAACSERGRNSYIFLGTAIVHIKDKQGKFIECTALIDSGSQLNLITERLAKKLGIVPQLSEIHWSGVNQHNHKSDKRMNIKISSNVSEFSTRLEAIITPSITVEQPRMKFDITDWKLPKHIQYADTNFNIPKQIDLLIGAGVYGEILLEGIIKLGTNLPAIQKTSLGWVVFGGHKPNNTEPLFCGMNCDDSDLDNHLQRFWEMEEPLPIQEIQPSAEAYCEEIFEKTTTRLESGRFMVRIPFKEDPKTLGQSAGVAIQRLVSCEKRLQRLSEEIRVMYQDFFKEYIRLGHMEEASFKLLNENHYLVPHHFILKPSSSTTKLRGVFDFSAKTSTNHSFNDCVYKGIQIQDDGFIILIRFRTYRYVVTGDIEKMFRQFLVHPEDKRYQLIYWRENPDQPIKLYQLNTVTYGSKCATYLATKCIQTLAQENQDKYPLGAQALLKNLYIDDAMTGNDDLSDALETRKQMQLILASAGIKMRKWCANNALLLEDIPEEDKEPMMDIDSRNEGYIKTLGLIYLPGTDEFIPSIKIIESEDITKRIVLSDIAHIYDPLGFLNPVITTAKILIQELWARKLGWDTTLPDDLRKHWIKFRNDLKCLETLSIPRYVFSSEPYQHLQLHGFADASMKAYGAVIYVRTVTFSGDVSVRLLCSKSRVTPRKRITIERLELCACKLLAQLMNRIQTHAGFNLEDSFYWSDSKVALAWVHKSPTKYTAFVANRIKGIQELTKERPWFYVRSEDNPADFASRGLMPSQLKIKKLWFNGPEFLSRLYSEWQDVDEEIHEIEGDRELKPQERNVLLTQLENSPFIYEINHKNSFQFLQRVTAFALRFIYRKDHNGSTILGVNELEAALNIIIKTIQYNEFSEEILQIRADKDQPLHRKSKLISLSPFLDDKGVIRVGGRLQASNLPYDTKHPIILPYCLHTELLMKQLHEQNAHVGPQTLLAITRQRFWPIKGKILAQRVFKKCMSCFRAEPRTLQQQMGQLPMERTELARPFINSGVDFCGPFFTHYKQRGKRPQKSYVAVFCCFATKAVHLELVTDLTTEGFIAALRRFCGRRGMCKTLFCDNGTNFIGAKNYFEEIEKMLLSNRAIETITSSCSAKGIKFKLSPPRAPNFGGLWEAAVKTAKTLMKRILGSAKLTYEELETVLVEIEAAMNSRPLTPMSENTNDLSVLTPGHFLIGEHLTSFPDHHAKALKTNLLKRWEQLKQIKNEFWERWSVEYLTSLQTKGKWKEKSENVNLGMMVLIKEPNTLSKEWIIGRIIEVYKGPDGLVRVAKVKTKTGEFKRSIRQLCPLPLQSHTLDYYDNDEDNSNETVVNEIPPYLKFKPIRQRGEMQGIKRKDNSRTNNENGKRPKLVTRNSLLSTISLLLYTTLLLPMLGHATDSIKIQHFNASPAIYFDHAGVADLAIDDWNILVIFNTSSYFLEERVLSSLAKQLKSACEKIKNNKYCEPSLKEFEHQLETTLLNNALLKNTKGSKSRLRRSPLDFLGVVANRLIGVLSQEDAEKFYEVFSQVKEDQLSLKYLLRKQTSIIDSTINLVKKNSVSINENVNHFNQEITRTNTQIANISLGLKQERVHDLFNLLLAHANLLLTNYIRTQSAIINMVTDAHHGKVNPLVITPQQLEQQLSEIKQNLPLNLRIPGDAKDFRLSLLYSIFTVYSRIFSDSIVFQLSLPVLSSQKFDIFKVIPIPEILNGTLQVLKPTSPYFMVNFHRDSYVPMSENEIDKCKSYQTRELLCHSTTPLYHVSSTMDNCEMTLLTQGQLNSKCKLVTPENNQEFIQLTTKKDWIFNLFQPITINVVCRDETHQQIISGYGLLSLKDDCLLKAPALTINARHFSIGSVRSSYIPSINISNFEYLDKTDEIIIKEDNEIITSTVNIQDFELLQWQLQSIKNDLDKPDHFQQHEIHQFAVGYLALAGTVIIVVLYIIKRLNFIAKLHPNNNNSNSQRAPVPQPRSAGANNIQQQAPSRFQFQLDNEV